jgi:Uma2 family endonuclease
MSSIYDPNLVPSPPGEPAWQIALLYPDQGHWSEEDYLSLDTGRLIEFDNGCIEVLPMPTLFHQFVAMFLQARLDAFVTSRRLGRALLAPLPVRLWPAKYREPDVVFLRSQYLTDVHGQPNGADLVMEVVSEGAENRRRDLERKREEYARAGIAEYWIIDPEHRQIVVLTLEGGSYRAHGEFGSGKAAQSLLLPGFHVDVDAVFAAGEHPTGEPRLWDGATQ